MSYIQPSITHLPTGLARQDSLLDHFEPDRSTLPLTHFVEWFSGDALDSIWTEKTFGSGTYAMDDAIDGGFKMTTGAVTFDTNWIHFNDKRHYEQTGSVFEAVFKTTGTSLYLIKAGLINDPGDAIIGDDILAGTDSAVSANYFLETRGTSSTRTATGVAVDTNFHSFKGILFSASAQLSVDGILGASHTSTLPVEKLEPAFWATTRDGNAKTGHISYFEAYNT